MSAFIADLRYALRTLGKSPGFTSVAVLILSLGIGATTAIFSLLNTVYLRTLPVADSGRLVEVYQVRNGHEHVNMSYPDYLFYRDQSRAFSELAAHYSSAPINLVTPEASGEINGSVVTASYFGLLGLEPALGRFFLPEEDRVPGRDAVAIIGHELWRARFGGDPRIVGKVIRMNATPFTVVGVAPRGFHGVDPGGLSTEVWIPSAMFRVGYRYCDAFRRGCNVVRLIGRMRAGRTLEDVRTEMDLLARRLEAAYPETNRGRGVFVSPAQGVDPEYRQDIARPAPLLMGLAALVLLIACANLASLLLARGTARRREIAIRTALGASRGRLLRQLLTESLLLSVAGGAVGLLVAFWAKDLVASFYAADAEGRRAYFSLDLDPLVLSFAAGLSLLTGILFGVAPALAASRPDVLAGMKDGSPVIGSRFSRLPDGLVVAQVALCLTLVTGAGLLLRSLRNVYRGPGFDPGSVVLLRLRPSLVGYSAARASAFQREVIRRLEALPGVLSASPADMPPLPDWGGRAALWLPGREPARAESAQSAATNRVGPSYFKTLGLSLVEGREFDERDGPDAPRAAIVNETLARLLWRGESATGRSLVVEGSAFVVVGVVRDAQYRSAKQQPEPFLYTSFWQQDEIESEPVDSRTHVRVNGDPRTMLGRIRREVAAVDPDVPVSEDRPLTEWLDYSFQPVRVAGTVLTSFGALGLLLSAIGLYGVLAFSVGQRTREIAIRMSLGADARRVARAVVRRGVLLALMGAGLGLAGALASGRIVSGLLYGVPPHDALTLATAIAVLVGVALAASYLPARRAARVDPMAALRSE